MSQDARYSPEQRRQFIQLINDVAAAYRDAYGNCRDASIVRTIWLGQEEGKPYDITALAAALDFPRQTVSHRVNALVESGVLKRRREGHSTRLYLKNGELASSECDRLRRLIDMTSGLVSSWRETP